MRRLLIALSALALVGLGCNKPTPAPTTTPEPTKTTKTVTSSTYQDVFTQEEFEKNDPNTQYAKQALANLASASSYHTRMTIPGVSQDVVADLSYVKDFGLRGTLTVPTEQGILISEVFLGKNEIFYKQGTSTWEDLTGTIEGKELIESLQGSFSFNDDQDIVLNGSEEFQGKSDGSGCTIYRFRQVTSEGMLQPFTICIDEQDLPRRIEIDTRSKAPIIIEYSNINNINWIDRPEVK